MPSVNTAVACEPGFDHTAMAGRLAGRGALPSRTPPPPPWTGDDVHAPPGGALPAGQRSTCRLTPRALRSWVTARAGWFDADPLHSHLGAGGAACVGVRAAGPRTTCRLGGRPSAAQPLAPSRQAATA